jgi:hypothetical protein
MTATEARQITGEYNKENATEKALSEIFFDIEAEAMNGRTATMVNVDYRIKEGVQDTLIKFGYNTYWSEGNYLHIDW